MADPRKTTAYDGIRYKAETFSIDASTITYSATTVGGSAAVGKAVTESAAGVVALTTDGVHVKGTLILVEPDGKCAVQTKGYTKLPGGDGASLTLGKGIVGAVDASSNPGFIREVATGTAAELGRQTGEIVDASDTTNVVVDLG